MIIDVNKKMINQTKVFPNEILLSLYTLVYTENITIITVPVPSFFLELFGILIHEDTEKIIN